MTTNEPLVDDAFTLPDKRTLAWSEYGDANGEPLLFFHGLPGSRKLGGALAADAASVGVRLIAPDRPGFGRSTFAPGRTFSSWAADASALADHLGVTRFLVAGISGGGPYTLATAHQLGDRVSAAGVISGGGDMSAADALDGMHDQNRAIFELARAEGEAGVAAAMTPMMEMLKGDSADAAFDASMAGLPPADLEVLARRPDIKDALRADGTEALANGVEGAAYECVMFVQPWGFDPGEITVPVVLWHGNDDRNAPFSHAQALAAKIADAELIEWSGMGHLASIELAKDILSRLLEVAR